MRTLLGTLFFFISINTYALWGGWSNFYPHVTWMGGSTPTTTAGSYGVQGTESSSNWPGARSQSITWCEGNHLWLMGGYGYDSTDTLGNLNDIWRYNTTTKQWAWMGGTNLVGSAYVYGTLGVESSSNTPWIIRSRSAYAYDSTNNIIWLFGTSSSNNIRQDLWRLNLSNYQWTWVSGPNTSQSNQGQGQLGTKGVPDVNNLPYPLVNAGARGWVDNSGNFYFMFGQRPSLTVYVLHNQLWRFNPSTLEWTWLTGTNSDNSPAVYGTKGVPSSSNTPAGQALNSTITQSSDRDKIWFFGERRLFGVNSYYTTNNMWQYQISTNEWTWLSGDGDTQNPAGSFGSKGVERASNLPGQAFSSEMFKSPNGDLWVLGGIRNAGRLNFLWRYNIRSQKWTWMGGAQGVDDPGQKGILEKASITNTIPALSDKTGCMINGEYWTFGGVDGASNRSNDLWRLKIWQDK